jgi:hypothetical protein
LKKPNREKNRLIRFDFDFISLKPKKPNPNRKEPSHTEKNRAKPKKLSQTDWTDFYYKKPNRIKNGHSYKKKHPLVSFKRNHETSFCFIGHHTPKPIRLVPSPLHQTQNMSNTLHLLPLSFYWSSNRQFLKDAQS